MAKFCPECGAAAEGAKFCPECGTSLATETAAPETTAQPVEPQQADEEEREVWRGAPDPVLSPMTARTTTYCGSGVPTRACPTSSSTPSRSRRRSRRRCAGW